MGVLLRGVVLLVAVVAWMQIDLRQLRASLGRVGRLAVEFAAAYPVLSGFLVAGSLVVAAVPFGVATVAYARRRT